MWELLARPSMEYATEVWWTGGLSPLRRVGMRLLEESNAVAGAGGKGGSDEGDV